MDRSLIVLVALAIGLVFRLAPYATLAMVAIGILCGVVTHSSWWILTTLRPASQRVRIK